MERALIIGAGIAGATAARFLAEDGCKVTVLEKNSYVGGACHDHLDEKHKCYVHDFGPHIFHTNRFELKYCVSKTFCVNMFEYFCFNWDFLYIY